MDETYDKLLERGRYTVDLFDQIADFTEEKLANKSRFQYKYTNINTALQCHGKKNEKYLYWREHVCPQENAEKKLTTDEEKIAKVDAYSEIFRDKLFKNRY